MKSAASVNIRLRDTAGQRIKDYVRVADQIYRCYLAFKDTCKGKGRFVAEKGIASSDVEDQNKIMTWAVISLLSLMQRFFLRLSSFGFS